MQKLPIAVLISGNGTNLQALIDACQRDDYPATIVCVIASRDKAYGITRAKNAGIPTHILLPRDFDSRDTYDHALHSLLEKSGAQLVCLAGFMRLVTPWLTEKWYDRMINIHPSLLPAFKGLNAQKQALDAGVKVSGCTVHVVRPEMDAGPIIIQEVVPVLDDDTAESLSERIHEKEYQAYVQAVRLIGERKIKIHNEKVIRS